MPALTPAWSMLQSIASAARLEHGEVDRRISCIITLAPRAGERLRRQRGHVPARWRGVEVRAAGVNHARFLRRHHWRWHLERRPGGLLVHGPGDAGLARDAAGVCRAVSRCVFVTVLMRPCLGTIVAR